MVSHICLIFDNSHEMATVSDDLNQKAIALIRHPIGNFLIDTLNLDFCAAEKIVSDYAISPEWSSNIIASTKINCLPENKDEIYERLLGLSPIFRLYCADDWDCLLSDFIPKKDGRSFASDQIGYIYKFINAAQNNPEYFDLDFIKFLKSAGYFSFLASYVPVPFAFEHEYSAETREELKKLNNSSLDDLFMSFQNAPAPSKNYHYVEIKYHRLFVTCLISLFELSRQKKVIRRCANCGMYFIPENRIDTIYCDNPSPQDATRTCKQYGSQRLWYERLKDDELLSLSRNIASAKSMLAKRNPDIPEYAQSYNYFRAERKKWKKAIEDGSKTRDEYREWLLMMRDHKRGIPQQ